MNLFMTSLDPVQAAREHCNVHRIKMIVETAQMLCTAHRLIDGDERADKLGLYKSTHVNHPCSVFVRENSNHYSWTYRLLEALCVDYAAVSNKPHATTRLLSILKTQPRGIRVCNEFKPVIAAPEEFKSMAEDYGVPFAYKEYMCRKFRDWMTREKPLKFHWSFDRPTWLDYDIENYAHKCKLGRV